MLSSPDASSSCSSSCSCSSDENDEMDGVMDSQSTSPIMTSDQPPEHVSLHAVGPPMESNSVIISNLPPSLSESTIRSLFSEAGSIRHIWLSHHSLSSKSLGVAHILYDTTSAALLAVKIYHKIILQNNQLQCVGMNPSQIINFKFRDRSYSSELSVSRRRSIQRLQPAQSLSLLKMNPRLIEESRTKSINMVSHSSSDGITSPPFNTTNIPTSTPASPIPHHQSRIVSTPPPSPVAPRPSVSWTALMVIDEVSILYILSLFVIIFMHTRYCVFFNVFYILTIYVWFVISLLPFPFVSMRGLLDYLTSFNNLM